MQSLLGPTAGEGEAQVSITELLALGDVSCQLCSIQTAQLRRGRARDMEQLSQSSMISKYRAGIGTQVHGTTNAEIFSTRSVLQQKDGWRGPLTDQLQCQNTLTEPGELLLMPTCLTSSSLSPSLTFPPVP